MAGGPFNQIYADLANVQPAPGDPIPEDVVAVDPSMNPFANNPMLAKIYEQQQRDAQARRAAQQQQMDLISQQAERYGRPGISDLDKASLLFQAAGALAAPTRSGALMESIGAAGTAVSGPLQKAAQAERDRQDKMAQLQLARAKLAAEMGSGGVSASDLLQLYKVQQEGIQKPGERERLIQSLPEDQRQEAVRSSLGIREKEDLKTLTMPDGSQMTVLFKDGKVYDPILGAPLPSDLLTSRAAGTVEARRAEAEASGIPMPDRDIFRNLTPKAREAARAKAIADGTKLLDNIEKDAPTAGLQGDIRTAQRFLDLNYENQNTTGPFAGKVAWMSDAGREMNAIGAELSRKMRQPGEGATSDYDARMFGKMTLSTDNDYKVNRNIGLGVVAQKKLEVERRDFMREYLSQNGTLDGAQKNWQKYLDANPVFAKGQLDDKGNLKVKIENVRLNKERKDWREFFRDELSSAPRGAFVRDQNGKLVPAGD